MKKCPYCAEEIQDEAIKCRYCGEFLNGQRPPALPPHQKLPWYFGTAFIVILVLSFPPLALPSIWWHPSLSRTWKAVITVAIIGLTWLMVVSIQASLRSINEAMKMMNSF